MDAASSRLTPMSMPSPFDYTDDSVTGPFAGMPRQGSKPRQQQPQQYPQSPLQRQPPPQVQPNSATRSNGLLGKMFRKSTSKHPKLNPMGISSKDLFGDGPRSATGLSSCSEYSASAKGMKLVRKPSALLAATLQPGLLSPTTPAMQSMVPKSTTALTFGFGADDMGEAKQSMYAPHGHRSNNSLRNVAAYTPPATSHGFGDSRLHAHWPDYSPRIKADIAKADDEAKDTAQPQPQPRSRPARLDIGTAEVPVPSAPNSPFERGMQTQTQADATGSLDALAVSSSELLEMYSEAERGVAAGAGAGAGADERSHGGGSTWRAKLSLTNVQRPETRSQRHQTFDRSSIDIAAHSRVYAESPLISVPSAAPASARGNRLGPSHGPAPLALDALLGPALDATSPSSAPPHDTSPTDACAEEMGGVNGLGNIDRDFLLTIQKNSALEARRQRRRETRRNTMSFMGVSSRNSAVGADGLSSIPSTPPAGSAARKNNSAFLASADLGADAAMSHGITKEHLTRLAQIEDPVPSPRQGPAAERGDQACKSRIGQPEVSFTTALPKSRSTVHHLIGGKPRNNRACDDVDSEDGGPLCSSKHSATPVSASARCSLIRPRPLSSDSLTYAEKPDARSKNRPDRSNGSEHAGCEGEAATLPRPCSSSVASYKRVLSELNGAVLKESIRSAAMASAADPKLPAPLESALSGYSITTPTLRSPVLASSGSSVHTRDADVTGMQFSTSTAYSSQSRPVAGMTSSGSVPPVPPLPRNITPARSNKHATMVSLPSPAVSARPGTANARTSPRPAPSNRRYRGSTSVVPSASSVQDNQSMPSFLSPSQASLSTAADAAPPPPLRPPATQMQVPQSTSAWDAESIRLQRYKIAPSPAHPDALLSVDCSARNGPDHAAYGNNAHLPPHAGFIRKLSQPDTHMHTTSHSLLSPTHSPDFMSKSVSNLVSARMSVDASKHAGDAKTNHSHVQKHGLGRLFSVASGPRKGQQPKLVPAQNHALSSPSPSNASTASSPNMPRAQQQPQQPFQQQPLSPTITSLVGDPLARRKIRDQLASSAAFDRLLEEDDGFTMAISLTPSVAGVSRKGPQPR
ncbi:hypothetical protein H4R99_001767 [Coemansia sp. RSA 1722]|nr:hypothetical protein H4R99_001767 [Coemansia sp. RSA 1722]